ncbi:MAG: carboxypeptidase-like regulatory domain-containing protein [Tannerellaceae bacterium]|nr:carboxypeptidase-like regulatory domain-containing protein [Tannerellaceae bacterium]
MKKMSNLKQISLWAFYLACLLIGSCLTGVAQISLSLKDKPVREIIRELETKTEYRFFYNSSLPELDEKISVETRNGSIEDILKQISRQTSISYLIRENNQIVFTIAEDKPRQSRRISGTISDESGEPVIGANVRIKGTNTGTISDMDGLYSLEVEESAVLQISYIGYHAKEVPVAGKTVLNVSLQEDTHSLDEVVVVGYGVQKRASVTGSVASIQAKDLTTVKSPNVTNTLAGKLPGLRAVQRSGAPRG